MSASALQKLKQARERLENGDVAGSQFLCEQILLRAPRNPDALCLLAMSHIMNSRPAEAVPLLGQAISSDPRHGMALEHLGLAHLLLNQFADAERVLRRAAALSGAPASVPMRLGVSLLHQQKHEEAVRQLQRALALDPQSTDCHLNLGQALAQMGDAAGARDHFHAVLRLDPGHVDAAFNLGVLALQREELEEACRWFEQALMWSPRYVDAMANLGIVLQRLGRLEQARDQYLAALGIVPEFSPAREGMAFVCLASGRPGEAIDHLRAMLQAEPENGSALSALTGALFEVGQLDEAEAVAERVCELDPADAAAYATRANVCIVRGQLDRAIEILESGYDRTHASSLLGMLTYQLRQACAWEKWQAAWDKMAPEVERSSALGSPFWLLCEPTTAHQQLTYTRVWAASRFKPVSVAARNPSVAARPQSRLRVGYLSSDLQEHAAAYLIAEVLELHDRERFEVFAYSHGPDDRGAMRPRLRAACEHFIDIAWEPDDVAAERIRCDQLDILVDLKGYTAGDRLTIMARRPCDVQVTWLGYPGTTGASFMDYLIADAFIIPPGQESAYSERIVRMPHCYQPNDRKRPIGEPRSRSEYGIPENAFVFCCFNQTYKITPDVFAVWMRLLKNVPGSVLWLVESNRWAKQELVKRAEAQGVEAERLVFASRVPYAAHLARYRVADLALDTFPYTSHTILSDALWCGCPTVGLCGETFAARVSGSLLTAAGMPDLVTDSLADYEALAYRLATDPLYRREIRARVAQARDHAPLFDSTQFTRDLERIYTTLVNHAAH